MIGWPLASATALEITLDGLTFSDEQGGLRLLDGWGHGTLDDPFVLVEEITDHGPAILTIRNLNHRFGNRIRSHHDVGFALTKVVHNRTDQPWTLFNLELREYLDRESPFGDGLSFGQASEVGRPFLSDGFADRVETREPYDGVSFFDGEIAPGAAVALSFVVTDTTPRQDWVLADAFERPVPLERRARGAQRRVGAILASGRSWTYRGPPRRRSESMARRPSCMRTNGPTS